jgi:hypothetical protein
VCLHQVLRDVDQLLEVVRLLGCDDLADEFLQDNVQLLDLEAPEDLLVVEG